MEKYISTLIDLQNYEHPFTLDDLCYKRIDSKLEVTLKGLTTRIISFHPDDEIEFKKYMELIEFLYMTTHAIVKEATGELVEYQRIRDSFNLSYIKTLAKFYIEDISVRFVDEYLSQQLHQADLNASIECSLASNSKQLSKAVFDYPGKISAIQHLAKKWLPYSYDISKLYKPELRIPFYLIQDYKIRDIEVEIKKIDNLMPFVSMDDGSRFTMIVENECIVDYFYPEEYLKNIYKISRIIHWKFKEKFE